jgi:DNA-binding PadR family transcriptional regulator
MPLDRKLSTLEQTALGIIYKRGPCKAYFVLSEFANSQNATYTSGAGSVYPLLKRLEEGGLISHSLDGEHKLYSLTPAGLEALRGWFDLEGDHSAVSCCLDTLRSRAYFLKVLGDSQRKAFLEAVLSSLNRLLAQSRKQVAHYRKSGDEFSELAMEGAVLETQARIRWVKKLAEAMVVQKLP